jgi:hypothetical protein
VEHKNEIALRCGAIIIERCSPQPEAAIRGSEARGYLLICDMDNKREAGPAVAPRSRGSLTGAAQAATGCRLR